MTSVSVGLARRPPGECGDGDDEQGADPEEDHGRAHDRHGPGPDHGLPRQGFRQVGGKVARKRQVVPRHRMDEAQHRRMEGLTAETERQRAQRVHRTLDRCVQRDLDVVLRADEVEAPEHRSAAPGDDGARQVCR